MHQSNRKIDIKNEWSIPSILILHLHRFILSWLILTTSSLFILLAQLNPHCEKSQHPRTTSIDVKWSNLVTYLLLRTTCFRVISMSCKVQYVTKTKVRMFRWYVKSITIHCFNTLKIMSQLHTFSGAENTASTHIYQRVKFLDLWHFWCIRKLYRNIGRNTYIYINHVCERPPSERCVVISNLK